MARSDEMCPLSIYLASPGVTRCSQAVKPRRFSLMVEAIISIDPLARLSLLGHHSITAGHGSMG